MLQARRPLWYRHRLLETVVGSGRTEEAIMRHAHGTPYPVHTSLLVSVAERFGLHLLSHSFRHLPTPLFFFHQDHERL